MAEKRKKSKPLSASAEKYIQNQAPSLDLLQANFAKFIDGGKVPIFQVDPARAQWRHGQEAESKVLSVAKAEPGRPTLIWCGKEKGITYRGETFRYNKLKNPEARPRATRFWLRRGTR